MDPLVLNHVAYLSVAQFGLDAPPRRKDYRSTTNDVDKTSARGLKPSANLPTSYPDPRKRDFG